MNASSIITLTTDFGLRDEYIGVLKGVIATINPHARVIDLSHAIEAHDLLWVNYLIDKNYDFFPTGTIHTLVVDPGVGTQRDIIIVKAADHFFVCPDNGLITKVVREGNVQRVVRLDNSQYWLSRVSNTFHGRDIFAPVAAYLSLGEPMEKMGPVVKNIATIQLPEPELKAGSIRGTVIHIDHFGNLLTNIEDKHIKKLNARPSKLILRIGRRTINGLKSAYASVARGDLLAIIGSRRLLEISVNLGSAAALTNAGVGTPVSISKSS